MKIRNRFVSNSSSSSFVILSTKENIKQALDLLPPKAKKFIKESFVMSGERETVLVDGKQYELRFGTYFTDDWPIDECECENPEKCKCKYFMSEEEIFDNIKLFERNVKPLCFIKEY